MKKILLTLVSALMIFGLVMPISAQENRATIKYNSGKEEISVEVDSKDYRIPGVTYGYVTNKTVMENIPEGFEFDDEVKEEYEYKKDRVVDIKVKKINEETAKKVLVQFVADDKNVGEAVLVNAEFYNEGNNSGLSKGYIKLSTLKASLPKGYVLADENIDYEFRKENIGAEGTALVVKVNKLPETAKKVLVQFVDDGKNVGEAVLVDAEFYNEGNNSGVNKGYIKLSTLKASLPKGYVLADENIDYEFRKENIGAEGIALKVELNKISLPEKPLEPEKPSNSSKPTINCAGSKDKNCDGVVTCEEEKGQGWSWDESKKVCAFTGKVSTIIVNTSTK